MRIFRFWTREQCTEAILALEEGLASGAQSISYPAGGSLSYTSLENAEKLLCALYGRIDDLDGRRSRKSVRVLPFIVKRGY